MELSLNAVWLLFAVVATYLCAQRQGRSKSSPRELVRALLASSILCVVLFPVISATDDLHPAQALVEESAVRKTTSGTSAAPLSGLAGHSGIFLFLLPFVPFAVTFRRIGHTLEYAEPSVAIGFASRQRGRAPPSTAR